MFRKMNLIKSDRNSLNLINGLNTRPTGLTSSYLQASSDGRKNGSNNSKSFVNSKLTIKNDILNLTGVKYEIAGRMTRRRTASRSSLISKYKGTFKFGSKKSFIDYTKFSHKNKNGAFTVKVWLSSNNPLI